MNRSEKTKSWYLRNLPQVLSRRIKYHSHQVHYHMTSPFLFIHINKTAGSSIQAALNIPHEHMTAEQYRKRLSKWQFEKRFKFAIVRNPWGRAVSHYHYRVQTNKSNLASNTLSFSDWVHLAFEKQDADYLDTPKMFLPQMDWITDKHTGEVIVDFVGRFENLQQDFDTICKHIGRDVALPHKKRTKHEHYSQYYDDVSEKTIREYFQADIDYFGYEFERL